jgi:hypothetical protein
VLSFSEESNLANYEMRNLGIYIHFVHYCDGV